MSGSIRKKLKKKEEVVREGKILVMVDISPTFTRSDGFVA